MTVLDRHGAEGLPYDGGPPDRPVSPGSSGGVRQGPHGLDAGIQGGAAGNDRAGPLANPPAASLAEVERLVNVLSPEGTSPMSAHEKAVGKRDLIGIFQGWTQHLIVAKSSGFKKGRK